MAKIKVGTSGPDNLTGDFDDSNFIFGLAGSDTLTGGNLSDVLDGGGGNDALRGLGGADLLYGGPGDDTLTGDAGNDLLVGGAGADTQIGGLNSDTFAFLSTGDSRPGNPDTIRDFGEHHDTVPPPDGTFEDTSLREPDTIALTLIDADTHVRGNQAFLWGDMHAPGTGDTGVEPNSVTWYYQGTNTIVQADVNGDTTADFMIVLTGLHSLTADDFLL